MLIFFRHATGTLKPVLFERAGVASFEYVVLAACIVGVVASVFNADTRSTLTNALTTAMNTVLGALAAAVAG
jgi:pilus assembly protein Flp/PilA